MLERVKTKNVLYKPGRSKYTNIHIYLWIIFMNNIFILSHITRCHVYYLHYYSYNMCFTNNICIYICPPKKLSAILFTDSSSQCIIQDLAWILNYACTSMFCRTPLEEGYLDSQSWIVSTGTKMAQISQHARSCQSMSYFFIVQHLCVPKMVWMDNLELFP